MKKFVKLYKVLILAIILISLSCKKETFEQFDEKILERDTVTSSELYRVAASLCDLHNKSDFRKFLYNEID